MLNFVMYTLQFLKTEKILKKLSVIGGEGGSTKML